MRACFFLRRHPKKVFREEGTEADDATGDETEADNG